MGQRPLTFVRQLLSACCDPSQLLLNDGPYPQDVVERAKLILQHCAGNSIGKRSDRVEKGRKIKCMDERKLILVIMLMECLI